MRPARASPSWRASTWGPRGGGAATGGDLLCVQASYVREAEQTRKQMKHEHTVVVRPSLARVGARVSPRRGRQLADAHREVDTMRAEIKHLRQTAHTVVANASTPASKTLPAPVAPSTVSSPFTAATEAAAPAPPVTPRRLAAVAAPPCGKENSPLCAPVVVAAAGKRGVKRKSEVTEAAGEVQLRPATRSSKVLALIKTVKSGL